MQVLDAAAAAHLIHGLEPRPAQADLSEHLGELVRQRTLLLVDHARQRGVETEPGVDRDHEQVHGVRQALLDVLAARVDLLLQPERREEEADERAHRQCDDRVDRAPEQEPNQQPDRGHHRGGHDPDRAEVLRRQVSRPAGQVQLVLQILARNLRRRARKQGTQPLDHRPQGPLAERPLQLDLVHGQRLLAAVNLEALRNDVRGTGGVRRIASEAEKRDEDAESNAERKEHDGGVHLAIPRWRPRAG